VLEPTDVTHDIAVGVATVLRDAYTARFGGEHNESLAAALKSDPLSRIHTKLTLRQLHEGFAKGWVWTIAVEETEGYVILHGFALCMLEESGVFLAELHTHPHSQRQGLGKQMLRLLLQTIVEQNNVESSSLLWLNVARRWPRHPCEWPSSWYRQLGFAQWPIKKGHEDFVTQTLQLPLHRMRSSVGQVLANLAE